MSKKELDTVGKCGGDDDEDWSGLTGWIGGTQSSLFHMMSKDLLGAKNKHVMLQYSSFFNQLNYVCLIHVSNPSFGDPTTIDPETLQEDLTGLMSN